MYSDHEHEIKFQLTSQKVGVFLRHKKSPRNILMISNDNMQSKDTSSMLQKPDLQSRASIYGYSTRIIKISTIKNKNKYFNREEHINN